MNIKIPLLIFMVILNISYASETVIEIIPLYNRPADEIRDLLKPLLDPSDRIIPNGSSLIVKTLPENVPGIKNLVSQLDTGLSNLIISVIQGRNITASTLNAQADIRVKIPLDHPAGSKTTVRGRFDQSRLMDNIISTQTLRTMDGSTAYIKVGKSHPVPGSRIYISDYGYPTVTHATDYIDATTGFAVTPRLTGDQVILEIAPWSDRMKQNGLIEIQGAQTRIRTRIGKWVEIGGQTGNREFKEDGILSLKRKNQQTEIKILVKVDQSE